MQKIHRRKNEEIAKDFPCTQGCGKAYGSYAALYTHIKTKHSNAKPPEMKSGSQKHRGTAKRSRPIEVEREEVVVEVSSYDCRTCRKTECVCSEDINGEEMDRNIVLLSDQTFIKFVNCIGQLQFQEGGSWVRNTEDPFDFMSRERLREMASDFSNRNPGHRPINLSTRWLDFLSFSSRFWQAKYINELYNAMFVVLTRETLKEIEGYFNTAAEFENIRKLQQIKSKEWQEFVDFIKVI